ncbi:MAG: VTT domain-containing protein [Bryobacteraceae bacterium]|nr:VTT domain-containing protein [Bryobacteraceae bacterium]
MTQLVLIALATLVSEDLACIAAGVLVAQGGLGFAPATLACLAGIFAGDLLLFAAGRFLGRPALRWRFMRKMVPEADLERATAWIGRRGMLVALLSRFTPGMRLPVYFAAGALKTDVRRFSGWLLLAAAAWTPLLVGLAVVLGERMWEAFARTGWTTAIAAALFVGLLAGRAALSRALQPRVRRLLYGRMQRLLRWEFWPVWAAYAPVVPYLAWLAVRRRSVTVFTAANPGIYLGGLKGESKSRILENLQASGRVPPFVFLPASLKAEAKVQRALEFGLPVVLKPDVGERGTGVAVIRSAPELDRYFETARGDTIAQQYVDGLEFGVFYYRYPGEEKGRIFSITEKQFPTLAGDGQSTVEELILRDARAVCLVAAYRRTASRRPGETPAAGEPVRLVEIGSHCRGAIFLDGARLKTPALEDAVDRVARSHHGFYFGRFDVRAPSEDAFRNGEFTVLELNGVSSEAAHIYDPAVGIGEAYRTLFRQWRIAFEIGAMNRGRGARPVPLEDLLRGRGVSRETFAC